MGKAWKFGDEVSTDLIAPGKYYYLRSRLNELAKYVLEGARPDFASLVRTGDFVVAGENFGLGSSREHAPAIIKIAGVKAVLAKSFARIFYRNCINIGLPAIACNTDGIDEGDELEFDMEKGVITDKTKGKEITFPPLPPVMKKILHEGGLVAYIKAHKSLEI